MRLIDADSLKQKFRDPITLAFVKEMIDNEPEAIVKCKDCKRWDEQHKWVSPFGGSYILPRCEALGKSTRADWYCANGERK